MGNQIFGVVINPQTTQVELIDIDERTVVRSGRFVLNAALQSQRDADRGELLLEVSNFDQQIIVAINGQPCFDAFEIHDIDSATDALEAPVAARPGNKLDAEKAVQIAIKVEQQRRWALGVQGGSVRINDLEMFRDVFYTPGRRRHAVESEFTVPEGCYFVQETIVQFPLTAEIGPIRVCHIDYWWDAPSSCICRRDLRFLSLAGLGE